MRKVWHGRTRAIRVFVRTADCGRPRRKECYTRRDYRWGICVCARTWAVGKKLKWGQRIRGWRNR